MEDMQYERLADLWILILTSYELSYKDIMNIPKSSRFLNLIDASAFQANLGERV
jgi:hypothetical protein